MLQQSKIPEEQMAPTTPSKKQARTQTIVTNNQAKKIMFHFCCSTEPRESEAPVFFNWVGGGHEGIRINHG